MDKAILILETSSAEGLVAVSTRDKSLYVETSPVAQKHNSFILPAVQSVLQKADLSLSDLDYIACGVGPGSFVGTRLAVSVCQGLGYASNLPLIPLSALRILATHCPLSASSILVAIDARMRGFYFAEFQREAESQKLKRVGEEYFYHLDQLPASLVQQWSQSPAIKIGSAWPLLGIEALATPPLHATHLLQLSHEAIESEAFIKEAYQLLPTYLNDESNWKKA